MPLFYQHNINGSTKLGIWKLEEPENFFLKKVPLKKDVSHPHKRLQHLAGRYLLPTLFMDFPLEEIVIADTNKPFLENEKYHFSISHCGNYAAAMVSEKSRVGVDIEMVSDKIEAISHRFMGSNDYLQLGRSALNGLSPAQILTMIWSAKEAVFKWYGLGGIDFRSHMQLNAPALFHSQTWMELPFVFQKDQPVPLLVEAKFFDELVLARVSSGSIQI